MTGTLGEYLVYRLQDSIKKSTGFMMPYADMREALNKALLELERDMEPGNDIELPTGRSLTVGKRLGYWYDIAPLTSNKD